MPVIVFGLMLILTASPPDDGRTPLPSGARPKSAVADETRDHEGQKYREILYPRGLPLRENYYSGKKERPSYSYYSEVAVTGGLKAVLYSERLETGQYSDKLYRVFVGLLRAQDSSMRVADRREITEQIQIFTEVPGNFLFMSGCLDTFLLARGVVCVHVFVRATLSGSGAQSDGIDLVFRLSRAVQLDPVLALSSSANFGRSGPIAVEKTSRLRAIDLDHDGVSYSNGEDRRDRRGGTSVDQLGPLGLPIPG
jgi:hypothetical protein